ncbi:MAG: phosphatidylglycerophosphatase A [Proteobacteria bacterium]|nr:phosphatidylglycerophosphatase A [Pseudomonadota bacterium]NBS58193.1 phosphatidylglycerophosphatase A [Betaproteobacteria bacterium]
MMILRPGFKFVFSHPAHFIAFGFGAGLSRFAPGTAGTLVGFPIYWLIAPYYSAWEMLALIGVLFAIGVWACGVAGRNLGISDHGGMCWDEIVAFLLILEVAPKDLYWQVAAFFLFRIFDVVKPSPIRELEKRMKGGFGVMFDDILAAGYTLLALAVVKRIWF